MIASQSAIHLEITYPPTPEPSCCRIAGGVCHISFVWCTDVTYILGAFTTSLSPLRWWPTSAYDVRQSASAPKTLALCGDSPLVTLSAGPYCIAVLLFITSCPASAGDTEALNARWGSRAVCGSGFNG